jgi:hypothetical protein
MISYLDFNYADNTLYEEGWPYKRGETTAFDKLIKCDNGYTENIV